MTPRQAMDAAVEIFGSEAKLAEAIGFTQPSINRIRNGKRIGNKTVIIVPPLMAVNIFVASDWEITREVLAPQYFGPPETLKLIKHAWSSM